MIHGDGGDAIVALADASVARLTSLQGANGAFVASPDFGEYQYCWLRDSSFIAYALDRAGAHDSSGRYHAWVVRTLDEHGGIGELIDRVVERRRAGKPLEPTEMPPARFTLDGHTSVDDWPNYQIDGYGAWLWGLEQHLTLRGAPLDDAYIAPVARVGRYLDAFGLEPCFDVWEENGASVHTSTLAAVYAGLAAAGRLLADQRLLDRAEDVRACALDASRDHGRLKKSSSSDAVDASTLWCGVPFSLVPAEDPLLAGTASAIEEELLLDGGVR
ncbi:MAG: glycoside hydrolase 15-related protein, partial [Acidimicrobiaceae bacterium]|nr:glycoside hydrolase 15-related protein [Acidimicrobiaceae bacterium]